MQASNLSVKDIAMSQRNDAARLPLYPQQEIRQRSMTTRSHRKRPLTEVEDHAVGVSIAKVRIVRHVHQPV